MAAKTNDGFVRGEYRNGRLYDWFGRFVGEVTFDGLVKDWMGQPVGRIDTRTGNVYDLKGNVAGKLSPYGVGVV